MYKLKIITSTVRPGRKGAAIGQWVLEQAKQNGAFDAELIDLGELNLPVMDEETHPVMQQYQNEYTKNWAAKIGEADAFIFVTAEYNYSYPAALKNAVEYLSLEWGYKPSGIVSYSAGPFAGVRAAWNLRADLVSLKNIPTMEQVNIPNINSLFAEDGTFLSNEHATVNTEVMLKHLAVWAKGLKAIKEEAHALAKK